MRRPSVEQLPESLRRALACVATTLGAKGFRTWLVGGAVRDLALERAPTDVDVASAATPEQVERAFAKTVALGRAFGTLLVHQDGVDVQHTTFRSEHGYSDSRRPDRVVFGKTIEEDARRRDFTSNAMFLDPLNDEFADPTGGLADLAAQRLRTVGDARERFREDGLRLLRMARFAGALELAIEPATFAAARECAAALSGVSPERTLGELERMFERPGSARAVEVLGRAALLDALFSDRDRLSGPELSREAAEARRVRALAWLEPAPGLELGLAVLFDPDPAGELGELAVAIAAVERLRASRATRRAVHELWSMRRETLAIAREGADRSRKIRLVRRELWPDAARLARAFATANGEDPTPIEAFERWRAALSPNDLAPRRLLDAKELEASGVERGPRIGEALDALETEQLEERVRTRDEALRWLASWLASR